MTPAFSAARASAKVVVGEVKNRKTPIRTSFTVTSQCSDCSISPSRISAAPSVSIMPAPCMRAVDVGQADDADAADQGEDAADDQAGPTGDVEGERHQTSSQSPGSGPPRWAKVTYLQTAIVPMKLISA